TPVPRLGRLHRSKEASSLGSVFPCLFSPERIMLICDWIIATMVEAIIRRWCCYVGGNNFGSPWERVISIREQRRPPQLPIPCATRHTAIPIPAIAVYCMREGGTRQPKDSNRVDPRAHF